MVIAPRNALKRSLLEGRYHLASSYLRVARYVFDHGDYREAADLAYNAAETAVKALLLLEIEECLRATGALSTALGICTSERVGSRARWGGTSIWRWRPGIGHGVSLSR